MKILLALTLLMGFTKKAPAPEVKDPPIVVQPAKTIADYSKETYPVKGWDARYSEVIKLLEKEFPITVPCGTELFLKAVINAESSFNNASRYMEPAPLNRYSIGFFQLSLSDSKNYGGCLFTTEKEIENPIYNLHCAMKIMNRLQTKYPALNVWASLGKYWSVLRRAKEWPGKSQSGYNRVKSYLASNGCMLE
jgi:hypothetical protein